MKARILSFAIALIALFSFEDVYAQHPHFNKQNPPSVSVEIVCNGEKSSYYEITVSGTVYGLGAASGQSAHVEYTYNANFNCYNRGKDAGPVPGQSGNVSGETDEKPLDVRNGQAYFSATFTIAGTCKGNALSSAVTALALTKLDLVVNGDQVATPSLITFWDRVVPTTCP
ncbi:hypothetical protein [Pontibacter populi]|uniref:Spore coat protein U domain-containing protein n=1 Tax=Pontibacter populi TaxID=890055 RepID=A0ABV1RWV9_9BACT